MNPFTMRSKQLNLITAVLACSIFWGCNRKTEDFTSASLSDYLPLQVGKYITYRLDSTVFVNFGGGVAVHSYQEKQIVDAQITDALGRTGYRILRFIRDTSGTQPWAPAGTHQIVPTDKTMEVIENNLRFIKLALPIIQDYTWEGNHYIPDDAFSSVYTFNNDRGMDKWDYTYSSVGGSMTVNGHTYNDALTVDGVDDSFNANETNFSAIDPTVYASVNYLQDNYAKGIGLISQTFIMWEYQPGAATRVGFGIKRSIIDHN